MSALEIKNNILDARKLPKKLIHMISLRICFAMFGIDAVTGIATAVIAFSLLFAFGNALPFGVYIGVILFLVGICMWGACVWCKRYVNRTLNQVYSKKWLVEHRQEISWKSFFNLQCTPWIFAVGISVVLSAIMQSLCGDEDIVFYLSTVLFILSRYIFTVNSVVNLLEKNQYDFVVSDVTCEG